MKEIKFVDSKNLTTLEEYGTSLLSAMISLKTLESFHLSAFRKGLLDEHEMETGKTICWEIQRLLSLYKTQVNHVLDRSELNEEDILTKLKALMPDIKIPIKSNKHTKDGKKSNKKD